MDDESKDKKKKKKKPATIFIDISGTKMPLYAVHTIKEFSDYNYDHNKQEYHVLINEQLDGVMTVYSNVKIKCVSELHMLSVIEKVENMMKSDNCEFVKI